MYNRVYNYNTMDKATDRERLPLAVKELGSCDVYPPSVNRSDDDSVLNARGESVVCLDTIGLVRSQRRPGGGPNAPATNRIHGARQQFQRRLQTPSTALPTYDPHSPATHGHRPRALAEHESGSRRHSSAGRGARSHRCHEGNFTAGPRVRQWRR